MSVFEWEHFKNLADILGNESSEASQRTAIGRYYYASFGHSRQYLIDDLGKEEYEDIYDVHNEVINCFLGAFYHDHCLNIGNDLKRLRNSRNKADYNIDFPTLDESLIIKSKKKANNIFKNIKFLRDHNISF